MLNRKALAVGVLMAGILLGAPSSAVHAAKSPVIAGVTPGSAPASGGVKVAIDGANFQSGAVVSFGGVAASAVQVVSAQSLLAVAPAMPRGTVEIRVLNPDGRSVIWPGFHYYHEGDGVFTRKASGLPTGLYDADAEFGDLDGDGDLDVLMAADSYQDNVPRLYLNDGSGLFSDASSRIPLSPRYSTDVELGDLDGDGDLDAVLTGWSSQGTLLLRNDGELFTDVTDTNIPVIHTNGYDEYDIDLGDVDGDGDLDMLIVTTTAERLLVNNGLGFFTDESARLSPNASSSFSFSAAFGDVDRDGDLDLLVCESYRDLNRLYINDGTGMLHDEGPSRLPAILTNFKDCELGDVDRDGDLDAFLAVYDGQNLLYLNDGTGVFRDATPSSLPALRTSSNDAELLDADGDGDLDVFVSGYAVGYNYQDRLFINDGTGRFADATAERLPMDSVAAHGTAVGDIDGDGDLDLIVANELDSFIYENVRKPDLAPPSVPTGVTATALICSSVSLAWEASIDDVGVQGYSIFSSGTLTGETTATSFLATGLTESATYCYSVEAFDAAGHRSGVSSEACTTTPHCPACLSSEAGFCGDGVDNDCDGRVDCQDRDCRTDTACR